MKKRLLIVYHTQSGNTGQLAEAVLRGARTDDAVHAVLQRAFDTEAEHLLAADGLLIGTPENFGYMSGAVKDLLDRVYYPLEHDLVGKPYALFVSAGNDGTNAVREIDRIVRGLQLRKVAEPVIAVGEVTPEHIARCEELGQTLAAGLELGIF